jgi:hypothetical protein
MQQGLTSHGVSGGVNPHIEVFLGGALRIAWVNALLWVVPNPQLTRCAAINLTLESDHGRGSS